MPADTRQIYVSFPMPVELSRDDERDLQTVIERICRGYEKDHPGRVMWAAGYGGLCTSMPITAEDEANGVPLDFDMSVLHIEVAEREDYKWPCAKCGERQDEHDHVVLKGKAEGCEFEPMPPARGEDALLGGLKACPFCGGKPFDRGFRRWECSSCGAEGPAGTKKAATEAWNRRAPAEARSPTLNADQVEWVVNDNAELGVKIGQQFFWLYKGTSLVYDPAEHDDGSPMHWRPVFKREFGECCHPLNREDPRMKGTVSLDDSEGWRPLPTPPKAEGE